MWVLQNNRTSLGMALKQPGQFKLKAGVKAVYNAQVIELSALIVVLAYELGSLGFREVCLYNGHFFTAKTPRASSF